MEDNFSTDQAVRDGFEMIQAHLLCTLFLISLTLLIRQEALVCSPVVGKALL